MNASVTIGEFSRLTHLTVKTLRHYHEQGLLVPYAVDPLSGYRRYVVDQVPAALLSPPETTDPADFRTQVCWPLAA